MLRIGEGPVSTPNMPDASAEPLLCQLAVSPAAIWLNCPYEVDVVEYSALGQDFQIAATGNKVVWNTGCLRDRISLCRAA